MKNIFEKDWNLWRHYKGGLYVLLHVADRHTHDGQKDVVYVSLTHGTTITRPLNRDARNEDSWTDIVEWPCGLEYPRFMLNSNVPDQVLSYFAGLKAEKVDIPTVRRDELQRSLSCCRCGRIVYETSKHTVPLANVSLRVGSILTNQIFVWCDDCAKDLRVP